MTMDGDQELASKREAMPNEGHAILAAVEVPWAIREPSPKERALRAFAVLVALLLHATILYALVETSEPAAGAGGTVLEAISVEVALVPETALQTTTPAESPASGTPEGSEIEEGAVNAAVTKPPKEVEDKAKDDEDKKEETKKPAQIVAPDEVAPIVEPQTKQIAEEGHAQTEQETAHRPPATPSTAGGAVAGSQSQQRQPAPAAASPGVLRDYASRLLAALERAKPKGTGLRGTVRLSFAIGTNGTVESVRVLQSSGNRNLDEAAVAAVRRASIPIPPASLNPAQRVFELPYRFR